MKTWSVVVPCAVALLSACGKVHLPDADDNVPRTGPSDPWSTPVALETHAPAACLAFAAEDNLAQLERAYPALTFSEPTQLLLHPSAPYAYVVEQGGRVLRFYEDDAASEVELVLDLGPSLDVATWEMGLLGFALRPDYAQHPEAFVKYTTRNDANEPVLRVTRLQGDAEGRHFDASSGEVLFELPNPEGYHHGGAPAFGPDGKLYVPFGDGGFLSSELAQDYTSLRGAILRVDIATRPYAVPADNPFVDAPFVAGETFATGFRNPFGFSFDPSDGSLWVGDVGEAAYEELDHVRAGDNHGWPAFEGLACREWEPCTGAGFVVPAHAYGHEEGLTIVGGPVYRGAAMPAQRGRVLFADFYTGRVQAYDPQARRVTTLIDGGSNPVAFTETREHEILMVDRGGAIRRLTPNPASSRAPTRLSETGCMSATEPSAFAPGLVPYDLNVPLWSDGADKDRAFALPDGVMLTVRDDGILDLPVGSLVFKTFRRAGRPIETRILAHHAGLGWRGYSYAWREDGSDADLLAEGERRFVHGEAWQYPSRGQCFTCHAESAGFVRGLELRQLDRDVTYAGARTAPQLATLRANGVLDDFGHRAEPFPAAAVGEQLDAWARAYLDVNCSGCHRPGGPGVAAFDLRAVASAAGFCNVPPSVYVPGLAAETRIVAPGAPEHSALLQRMESTDPQRRMPPLASHLVDRVATDAIRLWITRMTSCD